MGPFPCRGLRHGAPGPNTATVPGGGAGDRP
jgi:hypothetical protein